MSRMGVSCDGIGLVMEAPKGKCDIEDAVRPNPFVLSDLFIPLCAFASRAYADISGFMASIRLWIAAPGNSASLTVY